MASKLYIDEGKNQDALKKGAENALKMYIDEGQIKNFQANT